MTDNSLNSTTSILSGFIKIVLVIAYLALGASAQTKGTTPVGLSPGSPAGSYPLSDFETVNLFNGGLNFRLPLLNIGGRGGTGYSLPIHIEQKWSISKEVNPHHGASYSGHSSWWSEDMDIARKLDVGRLQVRRAGTEDFFGPNCGDYRYKKTLTRITFTAPDGTEYELHDQLTGGQPAIPAACSSGFNRQKVFVTADGTSATYISDVDIIDAYSFSESGEDPFRNSGYMMLRDGTRFRLFEGNVMWMRDRNGNQVNFGYDSFKRITTITDSLNRSVTISYGSAQITTYYDQISFRGFGGTTRTLKIGHCLRSDAMRGNPSVPSPLFSGVTVDNNNPIVINYIELPDGRRYQIQYNPYAEVARVEMPTGGAIEYEWAAGLIDGAASGFFTNGATGDKYVYRRVVERRLYPDGGTGSAWASKMTYSRPEGSTTNDGYVEVKQYKQYNSSDVLLGRSLHYFHGSARDSLLQKQTDYPAWQDSKEYKTETFDTNGTTLLRRVENNFEQRDMVSWWAGLDSAAPPNDVRLKETITTLADTNQVSKQSFGYDDTVPFNNQNKVKEYDFGNGTPGSLVRETRTTFEKDGSYTGADVHIRNLPLDVSVYDGSNHLRAQTIFEYDNYSTADVFHAYIKTYPLAGVSQSPTGFEPSFNSDTSNLLRGNVTKTTRNLLNTSGGVIGSINSYDQYDVLGNVVKAIDPRSTSDQLIFTTFDYADNFGAADSEARTNSGASELNTSPGFYTYAVPTVTTDALGHTTYTQYDYYLGKPVNFEDANGIVGSGSYDDLLDRPKLVKRAIGTAVESHSTFDYNDTDREITTTSDQDALDDGKLVSKLLYDKMGRTVETRQYEGGSNYIAVQTHYDPLGRPFETSKPFRPWQSETATWTTSVFDALGRARTATTTTDNAVVTTNYAGNTITVIDQAGKTRKSVTDALGRLTSVYEAPDVPAYNYLTSYTYDTLDNLTTITQGSQTRTFAYDSLKRLLWATNPESGTICYGTVAGGLCQANGYDANGNLIYKTDARLIRSTYTYDELNRNTSVDYSNTTMNPDITRGYDNPAIGANGKGRLWSSYADRTDTNGTIVEQTAIDSYDALGRPRIQRQLFKSGASWSSPYQTLRTYDLADHVKTQVYPSGHTVTYNYDAAGRLGDKDPSNLAFTGNLGDGGAPLTYAAGITYTSLGRTAKEKFGTDTAIYNKMFYNSRGQLGEIRAGTVDTTADTSWNRGKFINWYSLQCGGSNCNATDNNGNLRKQEIWVPNNEQNTSSNSWYQQYEYDALNRLTEIKENANSTQLWHQSFAYDRYGNRTIAANGTSDGINKVSFEVETATNRLLATGDSALAGPNLPLRKMRYDDAGNLTNDSWSSYGSSTPGDITRTYDADNRMLSAYDSSGGISRYTYNADGQRTRRKAPVAGQPAPVETWQIYGMDGALLAEYPANALPTRPQKEFGYRNGQLLITAVPQAAAPNTIGLYDPATGNFFLKNANTPGNADFIVGYGVGGAGWLPLTGDWNGDGTDTIGLYDPASGVFFLKNANTPGNADLVFGFGPVGLGWLPLTGDWDGDGLDTIGLYDPASGNFYLKNLNSGGNADVTIAFGPGGMGWKPLAADWNGDGVDTIGLYDPAAGNFYLKNVNTPGNADLVFGFAAAGSGWTAIAGDWNSDGLDTVGLYAPATGNFYLKNANTAGNTDLVFGYGPGGLGWKPVTGNWGVVGGGSTTNIQWLVTDQLGTPRLVFDKTGALTTTKRHDYLPFGEELFAGTGGRTTGQGYSVADGVRQKFTQKERDNETGLDYFGARYYSSIQGRFTSADDYAGGPTELFAEVAAHNPTFYAEIAEPQSLNKYQYALNNPLRNVDPDGHQSALADKVSGGARGTVAGGASGSVSRGQRIKNAVASAANTAVETANGVASAFWEDNGLPAMDAPQNSGGRFVGHGLALAQGTAEIAGGLEMTAGGGAEAVATSPAVVTGVGAAAPAAGVSVAVVGAAATVHGTLVVANTVNNIFFGKGKDGHPAKDPNTVEGATDQLDDIEKNQANQRKAGRPDAIGSIEGSKQKVDTVLKKIKSSTDAPVE